MTTQVLYEILAARWKATEVDGNSVIDVDIDSSEVFGRLLEIDTNFPDNQGYSWQNNVACTTLTFRKHPNPQ